MQFGHEFSHFFCGDFGGSSCGSANVVGWACVWVEKEKNDLPEIIVYLHLVKEIVSLF